MIFYGTATLVYGYLMYRSGYLPKAIGALLAFAGLAFIALSFTLVVVPANAMLTIIADDLATPQGPIAQAEKAQGHASIDDNAPLTAAEVHGSGRAQSGSA